jgi:hypothetical protein
LPSDFSNCAEHIAGLAMASPAQARSFRPWSRAAVRGSGLCAAKRTPCPLPQDNLSLRADDVPPQTRRVAILQTREREKSDLRCLDRELSSTRYGAS